MPAPAWAKYAPETETPVTPIPLAYHQLLQANIPVLKGITTTTSGGRSVSLPAALTALISSANNYGVLLSKESFDPDGGEIYVSDKTTSGFVIKNTGGSYGETVFYCVFWLP